MTLFDRTLYQIFITNLLFQSIVFPLAQSDGSIQWNRDTANIWEQFTVKKMDTNKIALLSYHNKYVSAQPKGNIVADRRQCERWEYFAVSYHQDGANNQG